MKRLAGLLQDRRAALLLVSMVAVVVYATLSRTDSRTTITTSS